MTENKDAFEVHISNLIVEYTRLTKRRNALSSQIVALGGILPSEAECNSIESDAINISEAKRNNVYIFEVDWRKLILEALKSIPNPCELKDISEEILLDRQKLSISTFHNHVKFFINFVIESNEVGVLPYCKKKYFLM